MKRFKVARPASLTEATELLGQHGDEARLLAGGTALVVLMRQGILQPSLLINLSSIPGLDEIRFDPGEGLTVGALTRMSAVERHPVVREVYPGLAETYHVVGNVRVRNVATVGGNLAEADYRLDPPATLIALGARVKATGPDGSRWIPLKDFFVDLLETALAPNEAIEQIVIPAPPPHSAAVYYRYNSLSAMDWPCVGVAVYAARNGGNELRDLRVVLTAVAPTPHAVGRLEEIAVGRAPSRSLFADIGDLAAEQVNPTEDASGSEWYKRQATKVCVRRALERAALRAGMTVE